MDLKAILFGKEAAICPSDSKQGAITMTFYVTVTMTMTFYYCRKRPLRSTNGINGSSLL